MRSSMAGWEVRRSDSVHPVHSWNCSQITEGLRPRKAASTKRSATMGERPTDAAAIVHRRTNSRLDEAIRPPVWLRTQQLECHWRRAIPRSFFDRAAGGYRIHATPAGTAQAAGAG